MADTTFVNGSTLTDAAWFQDVNNMVYRILNNVADLPSLKTLLHAAPGAIGSVTPSTGAFTTLAASGATALSTTLAVTGDTTLSGNLIMGGTSKQIESLLGTQAAPGYSFAGDLDTGVFSPTANTIAIAVGGAEKLRVNASGAIKLTTDGTLSTTLTNGQHEVAYNGAGFALILTNPATGSIEQGLKIQYTADSPNGAGNEFLVCADSTTTRLKIASNGNVLNANNSYGAISDSRLKQDVVTANSQWNDVKALRLVNYRLKSDVAQGKGKQLIGFVADEVETISPGLVFTDDDGTKGVIYSAAYLKMFGAFQEAQARIEALEKAVKGKP